MTIDMFEGRHREWVDALGPLHARDGATVDPAKVTPYAYRHTYAQRHADAGVPIDVLAELLDHRNLNVTRGYYRVGEGSASDRRGSGWSGRSAAVRLLDMAAAVTVNDLLDGHVALDVECLDRIYLNGYVPNLQAGGQVVSFMTQHLGCPIPSPAVMEKIGTRFRRAVGEFAEAEHIPVVRFGKGDRKIEVMRRHVDAQAATGRSGVAAIGVAQEYQNVFAASQRQRPNGVPWFSFTKADRPVSCFYFYLWDADFGPGFIKVCAYFPYPVKVGQRARVGQAPGHPGRHRVHRAVQRVRCLPGPCRAAGHPRPARPSGNRGVL